MSTVKNNGRDKTEYVVNATEMKNIDRYSIETLGIPSLALMERAAQAVTEQIRKLVPDERLRGKTSLILCGMGNNGGDGLAIARMLHILGGKPAVYITGEPGQGTGEWKTQYQVVKNLKIPFLTLEETEEILKEDRAGLIVDALFGIGLTRGITGAAADVIGLANQSGACKAAVDIPSGISADTGQVCGIGFQADLTVTFGSLKMGCLLYPGAYYCGRVVTAQIGFPKEAYDYVNPRFFTVDIRRFDGYGSKFEQSRASEAGFGYGGNCGFRCGNSRVSGASRETAEMAGLLGSLSPFLPPRPANSHKGTFGKLAVIAGSVNMSGAALLAALAAYRIGTGLVRIVTPEENREILQAGIPEAILTTYDRNNFSAEPVLDAVRWADAVVMGPGLGSGGCSRAIVSEVLKAGEVPMVLDADALRIIGGSEELKLKLDYRHVVTPHPGEMAALTGHAIEEIERDPVTEAREFSHIYETNCVLKGARTVVARRVGRDYINTTGNSGMATAGSGDVLAGMIGGLMAQGTEPFNAAWTGVLVHGIAGDLAAARKGERAVMASDLAEALAWL